MNREEQLIALYLDDSLTDDEAAELRRWLRADAANLKMFAQAMASNEQLRAAVVSVESLSIATERGTTERGATSDRRRKPGTNMFVRWAVVACSIAFVVWLSFPRHAETRLTLVEAQTPVSLRATDGQVRQLTPGDVFDAGTLIVKAEDSRAKFSYRDGSEFSLTGGAELTLEQGNGKELRLHRGALIADVSPQSVKQPLVVRTSTADATVLGTSFAISASESDTLLQVRSGAVRLRQLFDEQSVAVTANEQVRAGRTSHNPIRAVPIPVVPSQWGANLMTEPSPAWVGQWSDSGTLLASPRTVFLKDTEVYETNFHAGAIGRFPGLVTLEETSVVRVRYRTSRPVNLGIFVCTHAPSWKFSGNFEVYIIHEKTPQDDAGWRTAAMPIASFHSIGRPLPFQPGCVAGTLYVTSFDKDVSLEVSELQVVSEAAVDEE